MNSTKTSQAVKNSFSGKTERALADAARAQATVLETKRENDILTAERERYAIKYKAVFYYETLDNIFFSCIHVRHRIILAGCGMFLSTYVTFCSGV